MTGVASLALVVLLAMFAPPALGASSCPNPVACENALPGDPPSDWQVTGVGDSTIQGFATSISVNVGQTISFKIKTPASSYHIDILRLGYYGGDGARKVASNLKPTATLPQTQPACLTNSSTGLIDCGNWSVSGSWTVPSDAVSGIYIAHIVRDDTGGSSQIQFVVRNDASHSDVLLSTSDATWEAYNAYGGNSLYTCTVSCPPGNPLAYKGAYAVSYNRPFDGSVTTDGGASYLFYAEYQMVRWLEENGYDVSYTSSSDVDRAGSLLLNHRVFMSSGHDEYWSAGQRANVTAARDAGVNLAFFSGNEVFWKTRWGASTDGSSTPYRTLITYKETHFTAPVDPQDPPTWTGAWADPRFIPPADGGKPQNALTGQQFIVNSGTTDITVPSQYAKLRSWRNTAVAKLTPGQTLTLSAGTGTLGYEWDEDADNGFRPPGLLDMSSTTATAQIFTDYGSLTANAPATHHLTLYRAPSGALVFGAGTVQWSWGLDNTNAWGNSITDPSRHPPDPNMEQATVNLLADMAVQPATPNSDVVLASPSSDLTPPTSAITSPSKGASFQDGATVTISGTATDAGGGVVAGVEVSTDGGSTWHPATLTTADAQTVSWSYNWIAHGSPSTAIITRAVDDNGNLESPSDAVSVAVTCPCSLWGPNATPIDAADSGDSNATELGMKFTTDTYGTVSGLRFYKFPKDTGTHVGSLWTSTGQLLAQATFSNETSSGWQQVNFSSPVPINPNTTYVISYHAPSGHYAQTEGYFYPQPAPAPDWGSTVDSPPLHALRNTGATVNGVYQYTSGPAFPGSTYQAENYWVDPVFAPASAPGQVTGVTATAGNGSAALTWTAPATGGPPTSYVVTPYIGGTAQPATTLSGLPAPTSATVPGLTNGTSYTFTVTATNPNGSGQPSAASNAVTPLAMLSVVSNGGFESGLASWTAGGVAPPVANRAVVHGSTGSALLGTVSGTEPNGDSALSQTVAVPSGSSKLTFWYWPATTDSLCSGSGCVYDWEEAQIRSTSGTTLASLFKNNANSQAWTPVTFDTSAYAGQTIVLWFNVHEDGSSPPDDSYMYLDDVALTGTGPTPPSAPTNVSATAGNAKATVSWTAPSSGGSPITSYTITPYIGTTAQTPTTITGSPPATTATITRLTNGAAYTFTVTATNSAGAGPPSNSSNSVTPTAPTAPGTPSGVSATAGNGQASVSWTAPSDGGSPISSYTITSYIGTTAQTATTISGSPPATTTTITGLTNGTAYTFTVTATNSVGSGLASSSSNSVTPAAPTVPGAPANVSATAGNGQASVSWTAPSDGGSPISSYTITPYIGTTAQTPTTIIGSPPATTTTIGGLTNGTSYTFIVTATNLIGTGSSSGASNAVTPAAPPTAPTGVTATADNARSTVSWTAPSDGGSPISSYTITPYIGTTAQTATTIIGSPPATTATVTGLTNGTSYTFTITATNPIGTGPESAASAAVTPLSAPAAPTNVAAAAGNGQATVSWTAPSNGGSVITSYTITPHVGATAQTATTITGSPPVTSTTINGLTNGTTYTFTVTATNAVGTGPASGPSNAVTPAATVTPAFIQQVADDVTGATSLSVTPSSNLTAGNRLIVVAGVWSNSGTPTAKSVTDSAGDSYMEVLHFKSSDKTEMSVWTAPIASGGGTRPAIKVTPTANADLGLGVLEYSGLSTAASTGAIDQTAQKTGTTTGAATVSSGSTAATTTGTELALGFYLDSGWGDSLTPGLGFTSRVNVSPTSDIEMLAEDQIAGLGATPNAGVGTGANTVWLTATVVFKHA